MLRTAYRIVIALSFTAAAAPAWAQEPGAPDVEGCKPSPLVSRMTGCQIYECSVKDFDAWDVVINKAGETKSLEGSGDHIKFACPANVSHLQLQRNLEAALQKAGYKVVFSGRHETHDRAAITAQKGAQWVFVQLGDFNEFPIYEQTTVVVKEMTQEMSATAQAMSDAIAKSGKLDVYGITFATGQATLTAASNQVLSDLHAVLVANPDWRLRIEGHTDNVGDKAANLKLSNARAAAVAAWLTGKGIDAARLTTAGLGDTQPVADNATEDGRAKNRRVVLIKQ
ncbi:MAG TPA: OmpA family protein [Vicinamibacterales bacterium]|nr:OmpA family protein [Vicinamibacterales bacterium]